VSAPPDVLLWIDFETTGLLDGPISPTLLECGWTITDGVGIQLTPLRHAYTAFNTFGSTEHLTTPELAEQDGKPHGYFDRQERRNYPVDEVIEMHRISGLSAGWALTNEEEPDRILRHPMELDRLLLDDLDAAGARDAAPRRLWLAGSGVARFEFEFLPDLVPRTMSPSWGWHYRPVDLSVELSNQRIRGAKRTVTVDDIIDEHRDSSGEVTHRWEEIEVDEASRRPVPDPLFLQRHRATTDVARALLAWRILAHQGR
jgi:hypothetical protein